MNRPMAARFPQPNPIPFPRFAAREQVIRDEIAAFVRSNQGRRNRAHQYRRWALEAEAAGDLEEYRRWKDAANKSWRDARISLEHARRRKDELDDL